MSSVLALVSKAVFDEDAPAGLDVGKVWPLDRWNSKNPALKPVADGGALFLVTVRPPERLWLVGVLESPTFEGDHWKAEANRAATADVTALIPKLVFATGKGLHADPGKLGMSLQTPRALADSDVALLRAACGAAKEAPGPAGSAATEKTLATEKTPAQTPPQPKAPPNKSAARKSSKTTPGDASPPARPTAGAAQPAPAPKPPSDVDRDEVLAGLKAKARGLPKDVARELEPLLALSSGPKALAGAKSLAKKAGEGQNAIAIYDAVAAAILEGAKTKSQAGDCHAAARAVERKLGLQVDLDEAVARARVLGAEGAVWVKELALLAKALVASRRKDLGPALTEAAIATVLAGEVPTDDLLTRLAALGEEHAERALGAWAQHFERDDGPKEPWAHHPDEQLAPEGGWAAGGLNQADDDFWAAAAPHVKGAIERTPRLLDWLVSRRQANPIVAANLGWLATLHEGGIPARVASAMPARARELVERILHTVGPARIDATTLEAMRRALEPLVPLLASRAERIVAKHDPRVLELLLSLGAPLDAAGGGTSFYGWVQDKTEHAYLALEHLGRDPAMFPLLVAGFVDALLNPQLPQIVTRVVETPALHAAFESFVDKVVGGLADRGTVGAFLTLSGILPLLCQPSALETFPGLGRSLAAIEPERLLWRQLQGGLMDEWGWPALDEACDRLGPGALLDARTCFPHAVVRKDDRCVVVGPEGILLDVRDPWLSDKQNYIGGAAFLDGDLLIAYTRATKEGNVARGRWLQRQTEITEAAPGSPLERLRGQVAAFYSDGHALRPLVEPELVERYVTPRWSKHEATVPFLLRVPPRAERSPLGARDGVGGLFHSLDPWRDPWTETLDGRRFEGHAGAGWSGNAEAILSFPERPGDYVLAQGYGGHWIFLPDAFTPLVQTWAAGVGQDWRLPLWSGSAARPERLWWHLFAPRDPAGSRALAGCSLEQASAVLAAARQSLTPAAPPPETKDLSAHYPGLQVTFTPAAKPAAPVPTAQGLLDAIRAAFPEVTHARLVEGIAGVAALAASISPKIAELKTFAHRTAQVRQSSLTNRDVRGLETFFEANFDLPGRWGQDRLGQQIEDVAAFLFAERPVPLHRPVVLAPSQCFVAWERMLIHGAELLLVLLSAPVPAPVRAQARAFLELYRSTPLATSARRLRLVGLRFDAPFADGLAGADHMVQWENRYFLRRHGSGPGPWQGAAVEAAGANGFKVPPGSTLLWERSEAPIEAAAIDQALRLLDERGPIPLDPKAARALAEATGLLELAAARMLGGCFWIEPDKSGRAAFGATLGQLAHARNDLWLPRTDFHPLISGAVPQDLEELYRPLDKGRDGVSFVDRLAARWNAEAGKRAPISMELVERLEESIRQPHPPFVEAARALREPDRVPRLTRDATWVHRPFDRLLTDSLRWGRVPNGWPEHQDEPAAEWVRGWPDNRAFSYQAISDFSKYLSWAYLDLPVGDPLRRNAARIAELVRARLAAPEHLLPIAMGPGGHELRAGTFQPVGGDGSGFRQFYDGLAGKPYAASTGPSAVGKELAGLVCVVPTDPKERFGGFFSLRTSAFADEAGLERALAPLGPGLELAGAKLDVFPFLQLLRLWLAPSFQRLVADLDRTAPEIGQYAANPVVSAPDAVAAVSRRHDLSEDAASLWLQLRWLPEPTPDRVMRVSHWSRERYLSAASSLLARKLIVEAAPRGTTQTHFLPDPLLYFDRYPGPVEASKLAHLGLVEGKVPPLNVPLLLAPAPELYRSPG